jgi:hypothetical protein
MAMDPADHDPAIAIDHAECRLWWRQVPNWPGRRLGLIGAFSAEHGASCAALLEEACARLREAGCTHAVGPMDGNTWRSR